MNRKKFCFIVCVFHEENYKKSLLYLERLRIPSGYEVEYVKIIKKTGIAAAYNKAMRLSDAKYKVYIHEGARIVNPNFLIEVLEIFKINLAIGMIGSSGAKIIPTNADCRLARHRAGKLLSDGKNLIWSSIPALYEKVHVVDSYLIATQYDIPWRDGLFSGKSGYNLSQSIEFKRKGYALAVGRQEEPWCLFQQDEIVLEESMRNAFLDEYSKDIFPLVSILMTTYNRPEFFKVALDSAINQTYRNIEIIIGDDSTNLTTQKLVAKYQKRHANIFYLKNPQNILAGERTYANHCSVLRCSKGKYINYLNDDDIFRVDKIAYMMNYYLENPQVSLVTSYRQAIDQDGAMISGVVPKLSDADIICDGLDVAKKMLYSMNNFIGEPTTVLVKRKYIDGNFGTLFGNTFSCLMDMGQWFELLRFGKMIYIKEPLSYFRQHPGQNQRDIFVLIAGCNEHLRYHQICYREKFLYSSKEEYIDGIKKWLNLFYHPEWIEIARNSKQSIFYNLDIIETYIQSIEWAKEIVSKS